MFIFMLINIFFPIYLITKTISPSSGCPCYLLFEMKMHENSIYTKDLPHLVSNDVKLQYVQTKVMKM